MQNIRKNPSSFPAVRHSALVCLMFNVKITYLKKNTHTQNKKCTIVRMLKCTSMQTEQKQNKQKNNIGAKITKLTKNKNK